MSYDKWFRRPSKGTNVPLTEGHLLRHLQETSNTQGEHSQLLRSKHYFIINKKGRLYRCRQKYMYPSLYNINHPVLCPWTPTRVEEPKWQSEPCVHPQGMVISTNWIWWIASRRSHSYRSMCYKVLLWLPLVKVIMTYFREMILLMWQWDNW